MYKIPDLPSPESKTHELADFVELLCWVNGVISKRDILAKLGRLSENDNPTGPDDDDSANDNTLDEVMVEIERREMACQDRYPFSLDNSGTILTFRSESFDNSESYLYLYLLLSTRLNMKKDKKHAELDGTQLFETLSAHALKNYIGPDRSESMVFGTAIDGSFIEKVDDLCRRVGEGNGFKNVDGDDVPTNAKDGKLDTVNWIPFSDKLPGKLIIFGQSKTGTNWKDHTSQTQPEKFIRKWVDGAFTVIPIRAFCVAEAPDQLRWNSMVIDSGLFFDRCRIVDFSTSLDAEIANQIKMWTNAAKQTIRFGSFL